MENSVQLDCLEEQIDKLQKYNEKQDADKAKAAAESEKTKKRSALTSNAKRYAKSGTKAMLKKNTVVTCLQIKGDWMKIPSGWMCCKAGNVSNA